MRASEPTRDRCRRPAATAALAAASLAVALLVAELLVGRFVDLEQVTLVHDPLLGFRGRPDMEMRWTREMQGGARTVRTNSGGYHDRERTRVRSPGVWRLAFLGDSFLEAYQVEVEENFSQRLARALSRRIAAGGVEAGGDAVEAVNFGVHGYGLGVHHLFVRHYLAEWTPDAVVVVLFPGNDLHDNYAPVAAASVPGFTVEGDDLVYLPAPTGTARVWLRDQVLARSSLMRFAWMRVIKTNRGAMQLARDAGLVSTPNTAAAGERDQARMLATADHLLGRMRQDLDEAGVGLLVFVIPDPIRVHHLVQAARGEVVSDPEDLRQQKARLESGLLRILQDRGIRYLYPRDFFVERILAGEGMYRNGFGHFTAAAHEHVARLLEEPGWRLLPVAASREP